MIKFKLINYDRYTAKLLLPCHTLAIVAMKVSGSLKLTQQNIPVEIQIFLKRALFIFIIWKLVYHLFLFPGRIADAPLTNASAVGAAWLSQKIHPNNAITVKEDCIASPEFNNEMVCMDFLYLDSRKIVGIADVCNALELYILYIGFLLAYPSSVKRVLLFSLIGIVVIYLANIIRLTLLGEMYLHQMKARDIAHHYIFKMVVYGLTFWLWVLFVKKTQRDETEPA